MECSTTTAASARLNLSQPTVSEHLSALEASSGLTLFERKRNRLIPTATAEAFYAEIARVYLGVEHLERFVDGLQNDMRGQVHFGVMPMTSYRWMPRLVAEFLTDHHGINISMPVRSSRQILEWVAADRLDFGVAFEIDGYSQVAIEPLITVPLVCYMPADSELAKQESIRLEDLDGKTVVQLRIFDFWSVALERLFERQDRVKPANLVETYVTQTAAEIARASRGYALIDLMSALEMTDDQMTWRRVEVEESFDIKLVTSSTKPLSADALAMIDLVRADAEKQSERLTEILPER